MADLRINYGETISAGNQVVKNGGDFQDLLNKIKGINNDLKSAWEGSDASKYSAAVEEQAVVMQKLANTIAEIGEFLKKVGNAYRQVRDENMSAIKNTIKNTISGSGTYSDTRYTGGSDIEEQ